MKAICKQMGAARSSPYPAGKERLINSRTRPREDAAWASAIQQSTSLTAGPTTLSAAGPARP